MFNYPSILLSQITKDELAQLLGLSEADAGQIIAAADVNGDGSLSIRGNDSNLCGNALDESMDGWISLH